MSNYSTERQGGALPLVGVLILAVIAILLGIQTFRGSGDASEELKFHTPYQAVLLNSGLLYFAKVESQNSKFITLSDVFYMRSGVNKGAEAKGQQTVLIKRGKEWWEPDRMTINMQSIILIEPVSPTSTVGKLIEQSKAN